MAEKFLVGEEWMTIKEIILRALGHVKYHKLSQATRALFDDKLRPKEELDAEGLQKTLFPPREDCNIFLSHSHGTGEQAIKEYIEGESDNKDKVFVDGEYWTSYYAFFKIMQVVYCEYSNTIVDDKFISLISTLTLLLEKALHAQIGRSNYFIFYPHPKAKDPDKTMSAWIASELRYAKSCYYQVRGKEKMHENNSKMRKSKMPKFVHSVNTSGLDWKDFKESDLFKRDDHQELFYTNQDGDFMPIERYNDAIVGYFYDEYDENEEMFEIELNVLNIK